MSAPRLRGQAWIDYRVRLLESKGQVKVKRVNTSTRQAVLKCKIHGTFEGSLSNACGSQQPCPKCRAESKLSAYRRESAERFEAYLRSLPPNYTQVTTFVSSYTKVVLGCLKHNLEFEVLPNTVMNAKHRYPCKACLAEWRQAGAGQRRSSSEVKALLPDNVVMMDKYKGARVKAKFKCEKCTHTWKAIPDSLTRTSNSSCPVCARQAVPSVSKGEKSLHKWVSKLVNSESNNWLILADKGLQLDLVVPELKLAIEYNGIYWHSSAHRYPNYHAWKQDLAEEKGYRLVYVYEDDWKFNRGAVKHTLRHLLGKSKYRLHARRLDVRKTTKLDSDTLKAFFSKYHVQGYPNKVSGVAYGLFDGFTLVSCMMFTNVRSERGSERKEGEWELLRFASSCSVAGGASRLFTHFVREKAPTRIISYSDNDMFEGSLYETLGFNLVKDVPPDYKVISQGRRRHKSFFRKSRLKVLLGDKYDPSLTEREMCSDAGMLRVYDSGKKKWEFTP